MKANKRKTCAALPGVHCRVNISGQLAAFAGLADHAVQRFDGIGGKNDHYSTIALYESRLVSFDWVWIVFGLVCLTLFVWSRGPTPLLLAKTELRS